MDSGASTAFGTPNPYSGGRGGRGGFSKPGGDSFSQPSYQQKPREVNTVYVGNLGMTTDEDGLTKAFNDMQLDVRKVKLLLNDQGKSKGAGFVTFGTPDEAARVVSECQTRGLTVEGNRLIVQLARQ
jgi:RNA recognition motif-containing protein